MKEDAPLSVSCSLLPSPCGDRTRPLHGQTQRCGPCRYRTEHTLVPTAWLALSTCHSVHTQQSLKLELLQLNIQCACTHVHMRACVYTHTHTIPVEHPVLVSKQAVVTWLWLHWREHRREDMPPLHTTGAVATTSGVTRDV